MFESDGRYGSYESYEPYEEWHDAGEGADPAGGWDAEPEYGLIYESPDAGAYPPGSDGGQPYAGQGPYRPARPAQRFPRRLIPAAGLLLAAVVAITVIMFPHHGAIRPSPAGNPGAGTTPAAPGAETATGADKPGAATGAGAARAPAITKTEAARVLSRYWRINNQANERLSGSLLGTIEGGTSYTLDVGAYRFQRAANPAGTGYVPFGPVRATYYIPRQPAHAAYPHWFAAAVTYAALARPQHQTGSGYLLFAQASPGSAWKEVLEPYTLPAGGPAPRIATGADGYATAVTVPGQAGPVTAASLDGAGPLTVPANLADLHDKAFWRSRLPAGSAVADAHLAGPGPVFGLRASGGGALLFYSMTAQLTLAPPPGQTFKLNIPGYFSPGQALTSARIGYIEQFATYAPPHGQGRPRITADASSIAARD